MATLLLMRLSPAKAFALLVGVTLFGSIHGTARSSGPLSFLCSVGCSTAFALDSDGRGSSPRTVVESLRPPFEGLVGTASSGRRPPFGAGSRGKEETEQPFFFQGARRDFEEQSGLMYFRNRYYDPKLGRFISRDPLGVWGDPGQMGNAQSAFGNNPVNRTDPLGLSDPDAGKDYDYMPAEHGGYDAWGPDAPRSTKRGIVVLVAVPVIAAAGYVIIVGGIELGACGLARLFGPPAAAEGVAGRAVAEGSGAGGRPAASGGGSPAGTGARPGASAATKPRTMFDRCYRLERQRGGWGRGRGGRDRRYGTGHPSGGNDNVGKVARKMRIDEDEFGEFVEQEKRAEGRPNNQNYGWNGLIEKANKFIGERSGGGASPPPPAPPPAPVPPPAPPVPPEPK